MAVLKTLAAPLARWPHAKRSAFGAHAGRYEAHDTGPAKMLSILAERFGPKSVVTDADAIEPWLSDWRGRFHGASPAILAPASTEEVAAIVALAAEHRRAAGPAGRQHRRWSAARRRPTTARR